MPMPESIDVALKEWDVVCRALESGRQIILLRKGGIYESAGEFELEHRRFLLFPTFVHQKAEMLKPEARKELVTRSAEPERVELRMAAEVTEIVQVKSRQEIQLIGAQHIWSEALIDMRFDYKPQNPLYLLLLRVYRLRAPLSVENSVAYAGCKSWVPLERPISTLEATPVLDEQEFELRRRGVLERPAIGEEA